ncbi:MAG: hypothetical protein BM556_15715 [Bacteriovorax sp. MedPE-SWde]|nr:MAG: hypothetical protein BM556_15715 [Bacteriovorax sp. MedPE-SWde]
MHKKREQVINALELELTRIISETNGINLTDTLELLCHSETVKVMPNVEKGVHEFIKLLAGYRVNEVDIDTLLGHPLTDALSTFFRKFPLPFHEEHIHLTGSLSAEFIYPRLKILLEGPNKEIYEEQIKKVYGEDSIPITSVDDVDNLIRLKDGEQFKTYLRILFLPKLILTSRQAHEDAAYFMASDLYNNYNVGNIRLKFTLSRANKMDAEQIPGLGDVTEDDVVMGLYTGFKKFQKEVPEFDFILSPSFRKELNFFDSDNFDSKGAHFDHQVMSLLKLIERRPEILKNLQEVDTVGDEKELYRKTHFKELQPGLRRLQYHGLKIRSHHGETWKNLRRGIQSVDNAMNIWHIDTLEHGLSLGINPNYYFHRLYQRVMEANIKHQVILPNSAEWEELEDMKFHDPEIKAKLYQGIPLTEEERISFLKTKFHTAREIEHYQHDILNRMIHKNVSLVALPSSNLKLTGSFPDYKDHPFSWWEKKGVQLGVGTDNYITLSTNFIQEMLILLYSDPDKLKITKLIMITTKENRRPFISHLLWKMRKSIENRD